MYIDPKKSLFGFPGKAVRDFFKKVYLDIFSINFSNQSISSHWKVSGEQANLFLDNLIAEKMCVDSPELSNGKEYLPIYISHMKKMGCITRKIGDKHIPLFMANDKSLGEFTPTRYVSVVNKKRFLDIRNASCLKPVSRQIAEFELECFMHRVKDINASNQYFLKIKRVIVFGEYIQHIKDVSNIDLLIETEPIHNFSSVNECSEKLIDYANKSNRNFYSYTDVCMWPKKEIYLLLKNKSRVLNIHILNKQQYQPNLQDMLGLGKRLIYEYNPDLIIDTALKEGHYIIH